MSQSHRASLWQSMPFELKIRGFAALVFIAAVLLAIFMGGVNDVAVTVIFVLGAYVIGGEILGFAAAYWLQYARLSIFTWLLEEGLERSRTFGILFFAVIIFVMLGGLQLFFD